MAPLMRDSRVERNVRGARSGSERIHRGTPTRSGSPRSRRAASALFRLCVRHVRPAREGRGGGGLPAWSVPLSGSFVRKRRGYGRENTSVQRPTLRGIRGRECRHIGKTVRAKRLVDDEKRKYLSSPRRFGKTLFLDAFRKLFEGSEVPFESLAVHGRRYRSVCRPVVRVEFGKEDFSKPGGSDEVVAEQSPAAESEALTTHATRADARIGLLPPALTPRQSPSAATRPRRASRGTRLHGSAPRPNRRRTSYPRRRRRETAMRSRLWHFKGTSGKRERS